MWSYPHFLNDPFKQRYHFAKTNFVSYLYSLLGEYFSPPKICKAKQPDLSEVMTASFKSLRSFMGWMFCCFASSVLTGCITVDVSESKVFRPLAQLSAPEKQNRTIQNDAVLTQAKVEQRHFTRPAAFGPMAMSRMSRAANGDKPIILACMGTSADRYRSGRYYTQKSIEYGDVILFDYPGYNESGGSATTENFIEASRVVGNYIRELRAETGRPILAAGHSLGGFVCADLIARNPDLFDGMVIETSAQNIDQVVKARTPAVIGFLLRPRVTASLRKFDVAESLRGFEGPILLLGGGEDKVLKVKLTHQLHTSLLAQGNDVDLHIFETSGHENVYRHPDYSKIMTAFFQQF